MNFPPPLPPRNRFEQLIREFQEEQRAQREEMLRAQDAARERERDKFQKFRDYLAIGIALAAAAFTGWQGYEAHGTRVDAERSAVAAERAVRTGQRPYVAV